MDDSTAPRTSEDDSRISRRKSKRKKSKKVETPKSKKKGKVVPKSVRKLYRSGFTALHSLVARMKASKYTLSEATLEKIVESSYGHMFLMFWHTKYSESHWEKLEAAVKKYLKCYKRGRVKNELTFEFVRRGETHIITSTPEKMGVMFGMPRMAGRRTDDTFLMVGGGWRKKPFYIRHFGDSNTVTRPMLQDAILKLLKRTGIKNFKECILADLIHSFLEKKINQNYNTPEDITGCVVYLLLLYAEHTHLVKPVTLPDDRYLPRAARWNIKEISVEFLKDMEASQYTFSKEFKDEYTMYEKEMLNEIAQRLPVEEVPLTVDWQEKFEDLEVKNEDLRLTIAEKWCELQSRKEDGLPIDVSILEELLNDIYHRAYPPPQPNSGEEESSSSSEEGHDDLDDTVPSATTPLVTEDEQEIPDDTQEKSNEQGNATPTMPVMGGSEENLTQFDIEVSQFKIWARSDLERKVKELQEEKSMPEPSQTEKAELQQTAATQVLGNIEVEIGSLRDRQGASLEEMLPNMQFMPLVCELPSLKELHTVPMEKLIDLAIHGKGIYTDEYSKYLQAEIMGDPYPSLGILSLEYPSTGSLPSLEKMESSQIFDKFYAKDLDPPSQVSRPTFDLGLGPSDQNGEEVQQPAIDLASAIVLAAAEKARLKADLQQPEQEGIRKPWDPIPFNEVERKKKMKNDRKQQPTKKLESLKYPVLDAEKAEEARLKKNMSAEKAKAYAETLQLLSELQKDNEPGVSQTSEEDDVTLAKRLEDRLATKSNEVKPIAKSTTSVMDKEKKKPTISAKEKKLTPKITYTPQKPVTRSHPQKRVDPEFASGKGLSGHKRRKTKSRTENPVGKDCPTEKVQKKDSENVRKRKAKGDPNLQELTKKVKNARQSTSINSAWKAPAVIGHHILSAETFEDLLHNRALEGDLINYWQYQLKKAYHNEQPVNGQRKYIPVLHIDPTGWFYLSDPVHQVAANTAVFLPIRNMEEGTRKIIIPMSHQNVHWTLLVYECEKGEFFHYNTWEAVSKNECLDNANLMAEYCLLAINERLSSLRLPLVSRVKMISYPTPQQGDYPDCAIYIMHIMKKVAKEEVIDGVRMSLGDPEELKDKIHKKRISLACKILSATSPPEESWNIHAPKGF
ncbi:uncharacterized protein LOC113272096 [Papaver somniferum]|uniref:uncharacterized protein LOC113272096 n=1 Tax=Papaver somniferum TaxID=3469 RepID=UPI000E6FA1E3|nr:uncharacterized protein LOC113272096 [Papaver somniferum]